MSAGAIVALLLALMPGATGDNPTVSSLRLNADGSAVGAVTATRTGAPAAPRPLRRVRRLRLHPPSALAALHPPHRAPRPRRPRRLRGLHDHDHHPDPRRRAEGLGGPPALRGWSGEDAAPGAGGGAGCLDPARPRRRRSSDGDGYRVVVRGRSATVERIRLDGAQDVARALEETRQLARERGLERMVWWTGELSTPDGLAEHLTELGLTPDPDAPALTTVAITSPPRGRAVEVEVEVEVRRVTDLDVFLSALEVDWEVWGSMPTPGGGARMGVGALGGARRRPPHGALPGARRG